MERTYQEFIGRYEVGRWDAKSWMRWNDNLQRIADRPENTVAANNLYDLVSAASTCTCMRYVLHCTCILDNRISVEVPLSL